MKFFIAIVAIAVAAAEASYLPYDNVLSYPSYASGLAGASYGLPAVVDKYAYPSWYGGYPAAKSIVSYPSVAPVLASKVIDNSYGLGYTKVIDNSYGLGYNKLVAPVVSTKVIDNSYGLGYNKLVAPVVATKVIDNSYGLGYNKLVAPVVSSNVVDAGLWNYGGYGLGYNKYLSSAPVAKYVL
ncbi:uncharacterized protein LOC126577663 [Anopheles aquasalis]|uniref:uncharacterized protein LOC126577663 n=1 Tax=Anopheles aquasalis TaxID=42839 RepID=UPI00215A641B|nr:uncharacterized protein LOC126577663 [Anopheles aquasalis]